MQVLQPSNGKRPLHSSERESAFRYDLFRELLQRIEEEAAMRQVVELPLSRRMVLAEETLFEFYGGGTTTWKPDALLKGAEIFSTFVESTRRTTRPTYAVLHEDRADEELQSEGKRDNEAKASEGGTRARLGSGTMWTGPQVRNIDYP